MFDNVRTHLQTLEEMKIAIPYQEEYFIEAVYMTIRGSKQLTKAYEKSKRKPVGNRFTEAQCRIFFKKTYEIYDAERDSLKDIGVANNGVLQRKLDQTTAGITEINKKFATHQAVVTKYYHEIDLAMSMERTEESDDTTNETQWSVFAASQDQWFATTQRQLEQCQLANSPGSPLSPIIDTSNKGDVNRS